MKKLAIALLVAYLPLSSLAATKPTVDKGSENLLYLEFSDKECLDARNIIVNKAILQLFEVSKLAKAQDEKLVNLTRSNSSMMINQQEQELYDEHMSRTIQLTAIAAPSGYLLLPKNKKLQESSLENIANYYHDAFVGTAPDYDIEAIRTINKYALKLANAYKQKLTQEGKDHTQYINWSKDITYFDKCAPLHSKIGKRDFDKLKNQAITSQEMYDWAVYQLVKTQTKVATFIAFDKEYNSSEIDDNRRKELVLRYFHDQTLPPLKGIITDGDFLNLLQHSYIAAAGGASKMFRAHFSYQKTPSINWIYKMKN